MTGVLSAVPTFDEHVNDIASDDWYLDDSALTAELDRVEHVETSKPKCDNSPLKFEGKLTEISLETSTSAVGKLQAAGKHASSDCFSFKLTDVLCGLTMLPVYTEEAGRKTKRVTFSEIVNEMFTDTDVLAVKTVPAPNPTSAAAAAAAAAVSAVAAADAVAVAASRDDGMVPVFNADVSSSPIEMDPSKPDTNANAGATHAASSAVSEAFESPKETDSSTGIHASSRKLNTHYVVSADIFASKMLASHVSGGKKRPRAPPRFRIGLNKKARVGKGRFKPPRSILQQLPA